ncbi:MAG: DUF1289 domain-containing protein [Rhodocyclaceae bacterium]|nr:DUF1289 domain-containing protein [Rhodocyclaceae bacterium]
MSTASPCINICRMEGGLCAGCLRTLDEIARWSGASPDEKRSILAAVALRQSHSPLPTFHSPS